MTNELFRFQRPWPQVEMEVDLKIRCVSPSFSALNTCIKGSSACDHLIISVQSPQITHHFCLGSAFERRSKEHQQQIKRGSSSCGKAMIEMEIHLYETTHCNEIAKDSWVGCTVQCTLYNAMQSGRLNRGCQVTSKPVGQLDPDCPSHFISL